MMLARFSVLRSGFPADGQTKPKPKTICSQMSFKGEWGRKKYRYIERVGGLRAFRIPLKAFLHICITFSWRGMWRTKRRGAKIYIESSVKITMQTVDGRGGRRHENK